MHMLEKKKARVQLNTNTYTYIQKPYLFMWKKTVVTQSKLISSIFILHWNGRKQSWNTPFTQIPFSYSLFRPYYLSRLLSFRN